MLHKERMPGFRIYDRNLFLDYTAEATTIMLRLVDFKHLALVGAKECAASPGLWFYLTSGPGVILLYSK